MKSAKSSRDKAAVAKAMAPKTGTPSAKAQAAAYEADVLDRTAKPERAPLVTRWALKRSGAAMTLTGLVDGGPIIQGGLVRAYLAASGEIVATHDDGRTWHLSKS